MLQKRLLDAHVIWRRSGPTIVFPFPKTHGTFISSAAARSFCVMPASVRAARSCRPVTRFLLRYINVSIQLYPDSLKSRDKFLAFCD
jgi:hypothetical protein